MTRKNIPAERRNALESAESADPMLSHQMQQFDPDVQRRRLMEQAARLGIPLGSGLLSVGQGGEMLLLGCRGTAAGLEVRPDITPEELTQLASILFAMEDGLQLYIGDLLAAAETLGYGDITAIAAHYQRDPKTLRNWKYICSSVETSLRKDVLASQPTAKPLTMGHYNLVAALAPADQHRLLTQAIAAGWSVARLREALRPAPVNAPSPDRTLPQITRDIWQLYGLRRRTTAQSQQLRTHLTELEDWLNTIRQSL